MTKPIYIFTDAHGNGRNRYALFRTSFELSGDAESGEVHLFADTRYRLIVNGHTVAHGPARFFANGPEYDTHDLRPYLRAGRNAIAVVVNAAGGVSFHSDNGAGGLIAWGEVTDADGSVVPIATSPAWKAIESPMHRSDTHYMSFALNAAESIDLRKEPKGWDRPGFDDSKWPAAIAHAHPDRWATLRPRSIPLLDERPVGPRRFGGAFAAHRRAETVYSMIMISPKGLSLSSRWRGMAMTFIHSPREQEFTVGAWWGKYVLNGQEMAAVRYPGQYALRQDWKGTLKQGWNTLVVAERLGLDWWDLYLGLPDGLGLELSATKQIGSQETFLMAGPWEDQKMEIAETMAIPSGPEALPAELGPWKTWNRSQSAGIPLKERCWRVLERIAPAGSVPPGVPSLRQHLQAGDGLVLLYDFGGEVIGRPRLDFVAAAGTTVDVTYSERLNADGSSQPNVRWGVDMAERCVARDGVQQWQTFHPRGFRYLEVVVTPPPGQDLSAFDLRGVELTRANYPVTPVGQFSCSDERLNEIWRLGQQTQYACMEDAYLDCPWRERGLYSGDLLVQYLVNLACFGDHALQRRCIELFLLAQGDNGLVPGGCFGLPAGRHPDYSAIVVICLKLYVERSGDRKFLRDVSDRFTKLMKGLENLLGEGDLGDFTGTHPYVDIANVDREGVCCSVNCFVQKALADGAGLFGILGDTSQQQHYADRAVKTAAAIRQAFWDDKLQAFTDRRRDDKPDTAPSFPSNVLPALWGIADARQTEACVRYVRAAMADNFRGQANPARAEDANCSPYFSIYALDLLYRHGHDIDAERFMRDNWSWFLDRGAFCCWEFFSDEHSLCHAWSASPTHFLSTAVLGVTHPDPSDPNRIVIRPRPGTLSWAEGVYPHPSGPIHVSWRKLADAWDISVDAPRDVTVDVISPA